MLSVYGCMPVISYRNERSYLHCLFRNFTFDFFSKAEFGTNGKWKIYSICYFQNGFKNGRKHQVTFVVNDSVYLHSNWSSAIFAVGDSCRHGKSKLDRQFNWKVKDYAATIFEIILVLQSFLLSIDSFEITKNCF